MMGSLTQVEWDEVHRLRALRDQTRGKNAPDGGMGLQWWQLDVLLRALDE